MPDSMLSPPSSSPPPPSPRSVTNRALAAYRAKHHQAYIERKKREALAAGATTVKPSSPPRITNNHTTNTRPTVLPQQRVTASKTTTILSSEVPSISTSSMPVSSTSSMAVSSMPAATPPDRPTVVTKRVIQRTAVGQPANVQARSSVRSPSSSPPPTAPHIGSVGGSVPTKTIVYDASSLSSLPPRKCPVGTSSSCREGGPKGGGGECYSSSQSSARPNSAANIHNAVPQMPLSSASTVMSALKKSAKTAVGASAPSEHRVNAAIQSSSARFLSAERKPVVIDEDMALARALQEEEDAKMARELSQQNIVPTEDNDVAQYIQQHGVRPPDKTFTERLLPDSYAPSDAYSASEMMRLSNGFGQTGTTYRYQNGNGNMRRNIDPQTAVSRVPAFRRAYGETPPQTLSPNDRRSPPTRSLSPNPVMALHNPPRIISPGDEASSSHAVYRTPVSAGNSSGSAATGKRPPSRYMASALSSPEEMLQTPSPVRPDGEVEYEEQLQRAIAESERLYKQEQARRRLP